MRKIIVLLVLVFLVFTCTEDRAPVVEQVIPDTEEFTQIPDPPFNVYPDRSKAGGDLIKNLDLPTQGTGVSVAVDCKGGVYYTLADDFNLYMMDKDGTLMSTTPITDAGTGEGLYIDEFAWDEGRQVLWAQLHGSNPVKVYQIDPATGVATFQFDSQTISVGVFRDGIAYDGEDDSIWLSGDVSTTVEHYKTDGTLMGTITPKNENGEELGLISGIIVGVGDMLYLGRNGAVEIVQVKKSNGDFIAKFASPGGARDEGLECDPVNFGPKLALWSREFYSPGFMSIIELESGTCLCGGGGLSVDFDIHPTSCPNPLNVKGKGVIPVAILGTADFDVLDIDVSTILLEGAAPLRSAIEDVTQPVVDPDDECDCTTAAGDGYDDLTLKFSKLDIVAAIGPVNKGDVIKLTIQGELLNGTPFVGLDCMIVR